MGVLTKLKSLLGVGDDTPTRRGDVDVTVEREPSESGGSQPAAAGGDAGSAVGTGGVESSGAGPEGGAADRDGTAGRAEAAEEPPGDPVEKIKGVGPSYAGRLANVGVETVPELAERDAEALAAETGLSEKRLSRWIEQAKARTR